jgi:putative ABC transport system substrate-binding protein
LPGEIGGVLFPAIYASRDFVDAGGLMTDEVSYPDLHRRATVYTDRIRKGAKPAELLKAAEALGLTIPQSMLLRADQVIE